MGMDFNVNVDVKTTGKEQIDALEKQINALKNESVKINVEIDGKSLDNKNLNTKGIGKQLQDSVNKSVKPIKIDSPIDFAKTKQKIKKESSEISKEIEKTIPEISQKDSEKWGTEYVNQRERTLKKQAEIEKKAHEQLAKVREKESDSYYNPYKEAYQSIGKQTDVQKEMSAYYKELEVQSQKQAENYAKTIEKTQNKILNGAYDARSSTMASKLDGYGSQNTALLSSARKEAELYNNYLSKLKDHFNSDNSFTLNDEEVVNSFNNMTLAAERFDNAMTQIHNTESKSLGAGVAERSANTVKKYYDENSKAVKKYGIELKAIENQYRQAVTIADKAKADSDFKNLKASIAAEGLTGKSFKEELSRGFKQIGQFAVTYGAIQRIPEVLKDMATEVLNVDTAMTELRKVSDANDNQLSNYFEHATESAKKYGSEINDVISSAADWKRLGYSFDESGELADVTTLLQRVGDNMTQESSASGLISTLKGFGKEADEAKSIVDMVNEVANTQPIDTAGLFAGLERSASSMEAANNTLEQTIGLITAANSVVQDPDSVGTAYKTKFPKNCLYVQKCA